MGAYKTGKNCVISESARIGENTVIGHNVIIEDNVCIGADSVIESNTIIKKNVEIGEDSFIGANCILGEGTCRGGKNLLKIGKSALIRSGSILSWDNTGKSIDRKSCQCGYTFRYSGKLPNWRLCSYA